MPNLYTNEAGKSRIIEAECKRHSQLRKEWFIGFESRLRKKFPDLMSGVTLRIVGSVARGLASSDSDIDIIILSKSSDTLLVSRVRHVIFRLLDEMKKAGLPTYQIDIQEVGNPHMFSAVANFRKNR